MTSSYKSDSFQNCIEFWVQMATTAYAEIRCKMDMTTEPFLPFFSQVLNIVVNRIVAPYELIRVEEDSENGSQFLVNVQPGVLYETMRDFIVYSTHIMPEETVNAISSKLDSDEISLDLINTICWSTGAVGSVLEATLEQELVSPIIESLIDLLDKTDDEVKYVIISGLVFISGSLKNFFELEDNISILSNIVELAFSVFPKLTAEQQIMIATYFKKTSRLSSAMLNNTPSGKSVSILEYLVQVFLDTFSDMFPQAALITLDCITTTMKSTPDKSLKAEMITALTDFIVQAIIEIHKDQSTHPTSYIFLIRCLKVLSYNIGDDFLDHFLSITDLLLNIYNMCNANISECIEFFQVRNELLDLFAIMSSQISPRNGSVETFFDICQSSFLSDYAESEPHMRDPHVLLIFGHIALKTQQKMPERLGAYYSNLFEPTASLFEENQTEFIDFSIPLIFMMKSIIRTSLPSLLSLGEDCFGRFLQTIDNLIQSPNSDVSESALGILQDLFTNIEHVPKMYSEQFYHQNAVKYTLDVISYLATPHMRSSLGTLSSLLKRLLKMQEVIYNIGSLTSSIVARFPGHSESEIECFIFDIKQSVNAIEFKQKLRNFLVTVQMWSHRDPSLYNEEIQSQKRQSLEDRLSVPGLADGDVFKEDIDRQLDDISGKFQNMNMSQK